ncbi:tail assembly protein [Pseudomonas phage PaMx42]|uniref:tail assembly protein n=1 Tax=Pseudomonas phage PaMx42 TaxID=1175662 RepID=UPI00071FFB5C|nr:tail assembly protein [Pseudomonas phage PaMx42]ALH23577.1 virion structural protein [Pseudomonas phage PaMx42]
MAGRIGVFTQPFIYGEDNPDYSDELDKYSEVEYLPVGIDVIGRRVFGPYAVWRVHAPNRWPIVGEEFENFFKDYYFRIHVSPQEIDLQTIASTQTREVNVWNAYPFTSAIMQDILVNNPVGVEIIGPNPLTFPPLFEQTYEIEVGTSGPANIDLQILFDFANVTNPLPVLVTGTRAVKFDIIPETPVTEEWQFLTDNIVAVDGTEQRIALRGEMPRVTENLKVIFDDSTKIRKFYSDLMAAVGRLWIPEYQYATRTLTASAVGTFQLYFDRQKTDIRAGEYVLIQTPLTAALVEIDVLTVTGATVTSALLFDIPVGSLIMPGSPALLNDGAGLSRYSVNEVAETTLVCKMLRQRSQLTRPGSTVVLPTYLGVPVFDKRPLADEMVDDNVSTGQQSIDNQTGLPDIISRWDYSRIGGARSYKVNRIQRPEEMDYWKTLFAYMRGAVRKVWVPTYRTDMKLVVQPSDGASTFTIEGVEYAEKLFPIVTHRYIEIETASGIHRTEVTGAAVAGTGLSTIIVFDPALPAGAGWMNIKRISFLLPMRLGDDKVTWKHYGLESLLQLSLITAEP